MNETPILPSRLTTPIPAVTTDKQPLFSLFPKLDSEFPIPILRFSTVSFPKGETDKDTKASGSGDTQAGLLSGDVVTQGLGVPPYSCF